MEQDYTADDRRDGEFIDGTPNLEALRNLWAERDDLYVGRTLKPEQVAVIRAYRSQEAGELPVKQRAIGWAEAQTWAPPR